MTTNTKIPLDVQEWIRGMVNGETTISVGHMMFASNENFRTESFEEGLYLLRSCGPVKEWLTEEITATEYKSRIWTIRNFVADTIRDAVIDTFDTAKYLGD